MSWSFSKQGILKDAAAEEIKKAFDEQAANFDAAHRNVLDAVGENAVKLAALAPEGGVVGFTTYGHINADGSGNAELNVSLGNAPVPAEPKAEG